MKRPTFDEVNALLRYDPATGFLHWRVRRAQVRAGSRAGSSATRPGVRVVRIHRRPFLEHCVAWLLMTGKWPATTVDHADTDKMNNRWVNLRLATMAQQNANRATWSASGFKGVERRGTKWGAQIGADRERFGPFDTPEEAARAYDIAAVARWGHFARINFPQGARA